MAPQEVELDVAQALFAARLLEVAVHHEGPWSMRWRSVEIPAERSVTDSGVTFSAEFPKVCYLRPPEGGLHLLCDGQVMAIRAVDHPGDTSFLVTWDVLLRKDPVRP